MREYINHTSCDKEISLHDCKATQISIDGNTLSFTFDDGFWVINDNTYNDNKLHKSDQAVMHTLLIDDKYLDSITIYVFHQKKQNKAIRMEISLDELMQRVNSKRASLEFLYLYKGFQSYIFECQLNSSKKPYFHECVIQIRTDHLSYDWNNVLKDRVW